MELSHCRNESCWLQNTGHSQREESLPDANPSEILREGRMMESEASSEKPLQPECHMYTGQELGQQPAHPASPRWGWTKAHSCTVPTALPRLHSRESPSRAITRCDRGCGQRSHSQQAQQHQHSLQGAASHDSSMPCLQLFRKKLCLFIIRNASEHTHPFWNKVSLQGNTQVQKHMTPASSLLQGLQTGKGRSARMRGKNTLLYFRKIQMGDKAEMKTGGSLLSKHNINPAINHTHAKVKTTQEFPDTEEKVMRGMQMLSAIAWTQMRNI